MSDAHTLAVIWVGYRPNRAAFQRHIDDVLRKNDRRRICLNMGTSYRCDAKYSTLDAMAVASKQVLVAQLAEWLKSIGEQPTEDLITEVYLHIWGILSASMARGIVEPA